MSTPRTAWAGSDYKLVEQKERKEQREANAWLGRVLRRTQRRIRSKR